MTIIRPQLDQVRIGQDGKLPYALLDAIRKAYDYLAASASISVGSIEIIQDTHNNRLILFPAASSPVGSLYFETDRKVVYVNREVSSAPAWVYVTGVMSGLVAARPADLGTNDAGFLFTSTDSLDYRWSGTAWVALGTVKGGGSLTNVGAVPKVSAAGTLSESAMADNLTSILIVARGVILDNGYIIQQKSIAGTVRNLLTHFTDDVVYLDNADGNVSIRPKAGSALVVSTNTSITGNAIVSGVFQVGAAPGLTNVVTLAKITALGANGSLTFTGGIITAFVAPT